jgi:hypothetical protein
MFNFFTGRFVTGGTAALAVPSLGFVAPLACGLAPITEYAASVPTASHPREPANLRFRLLLLVLRFIVYLRSRNTFAT